MNVHGFGNFESDDRLRRPQNGEGGGDVPRYYGEGQNAGQEEGGGMQRIMAGAMGLQELRLSEQHRVLFVSGRTGLKDPLQQTYWDMLVFGLCPQFKFLSLTFLLVVADLALFIFEMTQGIKKQGNLLQVETQTLLDHSNYYNPLRNNVELWRLLSAVFLHVNLIHFLGNIISTFFLVSRVEYTLGFWKTLVIYLLSGINGNIFSDAINKANFVSAGASTALYGMLGVILGYIILNWNGVDLLGPVIKCQLYCSAMTLFFFVLVFTPSSINNNIDWYGHLGGLLAGMTLTAIHQTIVSGTFEKVARIVFLILFLIMFAVCFIVVYTSAKV